MSEEERGDAGNQIGGWFTDVWATRDSGFDYSGMGIEKMDSGYILIIESTEFAMNSL